MPSHEPFRNLLWRDPVYAGIRDRHLNATTSRILPTANLIIAQAGAGKTTIVKSHSHLLENTVSISVDKLILEYPGYEQTLRANPFVQDVLAQRAAQVWALRLFWDAIRNQRDIVFEITPRPSNTSAILGLFFMLSRSASGAGYHRHAHVLAVNARQSVAGIFRRFEADTASGAPARWASITSHNVCYHRMTAAMNLKLWKAAFDEVSVSRRNTNVAYRGSDHHIAQLVVQAERGRSWKAEEIEHYAHSAQTTLHAARREATSRPLWYMRAVEELARQSKEMARGFIKPEFHIDRDMKRLELIERSGLSGSWTGLPPASPQR